MATYVLLTQVKDVSLRQALSRSLDDDGRISFEEVKMLLSSTLDGEGVTRQEFDDLKTILKNSKTLDDRSRELIDAFLEEHYRPPAKAKKAPDGQLTANFNLSEFACKDGTAVPQNLRDNVKALAENLQVLRDTIGKPIKINSGYRSPKHNKKVGGASNSQHLYAKAADIVISGMTPAKVKKQIEDLIKEGKMKQGGIGLYNSFVHYDIRGTKARW